VDASGGGIYRQEENTGYFSSWSKYLRRRHPRRAKRGAIIETGRAKRGAILFIPARPLVILANRIKLRKAFALFVRCVIGGADLPGALPFRIFAAFEGGA
jgi:hypothetical protein